MYGRIIRRGSWGWKLAEKADFKGKILCQMDSTGIMKRGSLLKTRHTLAFDLPVSATDKRKYPDKAEQRRVILALRAQGWTYREIAEEVGLHWTRVGQILKSANR